MSVRRFAGFLFVVVVAIGLAGSAAAQCTIGVVGPGDPLEDPQLQSSLVGLGFSPVIITSTADAATANAQLIIDRYGVANLPPGDVTTWLNTGKGYIELGDWSHYFANAFVGFPMGPITVTVNDNSGPLTAGLPGSWAGLGFWAYGGGGTNYIDSATAGGLPDVLHATQASTTYNVVATTMAVGSGRAAFLGINVYGDLAGSNDLKLLSNAVTWAGACNTVSVPTVSGVGLAVLGALLVFAGVALILRLR